MKALLNKCTTFKKYKFLFFLAGICVLNSMLCFLIEPARGSSATMWEEYYKETEIDTIFIGSSLCSASFDPQIFDEKLGVKSFNMGTPMQPLDQNLTALETAFEEHQIDTVVIGMGFFILQEDAFEEAELSFEKERARKKGGLKGFLRSVEYVFAKEVQGTEKSVNYWFPWTYNVEEYSWNIISKNVKTKIRLMKGEDKISLSAKGYRPYEGVVDYGTADQKNSNLTYQQELKENLLDKFEKLLIVCKENHADVIVINTPHPKFDILACRDSYEKNSEIISELCRMHEVEYYDFSMAKPEIFVEQDQYYYDFEHLNYEGSQVFSNALADFMIRRKQGETVENLFWSVEEYFEKDNV